MQKVLAAAGVASRRASEELIGEGRVVVDGKVASIGMRVDPARARIEVDGERIATDPGYSYVILNKPSGVVSTVLDPKGRTTVVDLVTAGRRLNPVGRLDTDTVGLIILTNHGELAHRLTHPRYQVQRVYLVEAEGRIPPESIRQLRSGVRLEDGMARARAVRVRQRVPGRTLVEITMTEGRNREVRRMFEALDFPVTSLARISFGPISLGTLKTGRWRELTPEEVGRLLHATGL